MYMFSDERRKIMKKMCVVLMALCIMLSSSLAFGDQDDPIDVLFDSLLFRPLGAVTLVGGAIAYVISLPVAALTDSTETIKRELLTEPYEYTFVRPIGEIESNL
jgi:hypothetical protein